VSALPGGKNPFLVPAVFNIPDYSEFTDKYNISDNVCQEFFLASKQIPLTQYPWFVFWAWVRVAEKLLRAVKTEGIHGKSRDDIFGLAKKIRA